MSWSNVLMRTQNDLNYRPPKYRTSRQPDSTFAKLLGIELPRVEDDQDYEFDDTLHVWLPRSEANNPWRGFESYAAAKVTPNPFLMMMMFNNEPVPQPPPKIVREQRDDYVTGYREWKLLSIGSKLKLLRSKVQDTLWPPGEPLSTAIAKDGSTGVYAWTTQRFRPPSSIWGTVALWGKVFEHADGVLRGEHAYPLHLYIGTDYADRKALRQTLANEYGCEVELA